MDMFGRFNDGPQPKTPSAVAVYVGGHLAPTLEAGDLVEAPGYLSREGTIVPMVSDPDLWREVGWDSGTHPLPGGKLIEALTQGFDLHGHKLAGRGQFRAPREVVFSLPSELSVALMELPADQRLSVLQDLHRTWTQERDQVAIRIMKDGDRTWQAARTLSLGFAHLEDRAGEPSLHFHDYCFQVAKDANGKWRAYDNGKAANDMPRLRAKLTDAAIASCTRLGVEIEWPRGLAREHDGESQGVTVTLPNGRVIEAGSLNRTRRADIMAAQTIRETLGAPALTPKELEIIRRETGKLPVEIKGVKRKDCLVEKLNKLGLLDPEGRILPKAEVEAKLPKIAEGLEIAAAKLREIQVPGPRAEAAARVEQKIETIKVAVPEVVPKVEAAQAAGRIRWTVEYQRVVDMVAAAGTLRTDGLTKQDRDLLSKLKKAGLLEGERLNGRMEYGISKLGRVRISGSEMGIAAGPVVPPGLPLAPGASQFGGVGSFGADRRGSETPGTAAGALGEEQSGVAGLELGAVGIPSALPVGTPEVGEPENHRVPVVGLGAAIESGAIQLEAAASANLYPRREVRADGSAVHLSDPHGGHAVDRTLRPIPKADGGSAGDHLSAGVPVPAGQVPGHERQKVGVAAGHALPLGQGDGPAGLPATSGPNHRLPRAGEAGGRGGRHREAAHPRVGSHPRGPRDGGDRRGVHHGSRRLAVARDGWPRSANYAGGPGCDHFGGGQGYRQDGGRPFDGLPRHRFGPPRMVAPWELQRGSGGGTGSNVKHVIHVATSAATRVGAIAWDLMLAASGAAMVAGQLAARKIAEFQEYMQEKHRLGIAKAAQQEVRNKEIEDARGAEIERMQMQAPKVRAAEVKVSESKHRMRR